LGLALEEKTQNGCHAAVKLMRCEELHHSTTREHLLSEYEKCRRMMEFSLPLAKAAYIGKSVKVLDKVGARTSALEKLDAAQITHLKNRSSFKQLRTHTS
jgi:hypothetical protein